MKRKKSKLVHMSDIRIPSGFSLKLPTREKIIEKAAYYKKHHMLDKPIIVIPETNENGKPNKLILVDGYISYLIMLFTGSEYAEVEYQHEYIV